MLYGYPDETGRLWEVHNDATMKKLPKGAAELTQEQFDNRFDWVVEGGELVHDPLPPAPAAEEQAE